MIKKLRLSEIVSPTLRSRLSSLPVLLKNSGIVPDLKDRLLNWLSNDDVGNFVFNNYRQFGFYYVKIIQEQMQQSGKWVVLFELRNLFTDAKVAEAWIKFNATNYLQESSPFTDAGFQFLQWNPNYPKGHKNSYYPTNAWQFPCIFTKESKQFEITQITQTGTGSGGIQVINPEPVQTMQPVQTVQPATVSPSPNLSDILGDINPMYYVAAGVIIIYILSQN